MFRIRAPRREGRCFDLPLFVEGDVPSIDEPQIYPLMLLGLSIIGYAVRRRKKALAP